MVQKHSSELQLRLLFGGALNMLDSKEFQIMPFFRASISCCKFTHTHKTQSRSCGSSPGSHSAAAVCPGVLMSDVIADS